MLPPLVPDMQVDMLPNLTTQELEGFAANTLVNMAETQAMPTITVEDSDEDDHVEPPGGGATNPVATGNRVQSIRLLLTYSCPTGMDDNPIPDKESLLAFLKAHPKYKASIVAKEKHKNGKYHYHALVVFTSKIDLRPFGRQLDFMDVHPNVQTVNRFQDAINYVTKGGDFIEDGISATKNGNDKKRDTIAAKAMELARTDSVETGERYLMEHAPADYLKNRVQMRGSLTHVRQLAAPTELGVKVKTTGWKPIVDTWDITTKLESVVRPGRMNDYESTWVLEGGAGFGKTQCAVYLLHKAGCKNIRIVRTPEQFKAYFNGDRTIDGVVFDELAVNAVDIRGGRWGYEEVIVIVDQEIGGPLRCRNEDVILEANVKRIITTNDISRALDMSKDQIRRRVHHVVITDFLFD
ncbi:rep protein [Genomoviridae sp.]|nr:rep protein [Genomoviridae sp.]